MGWPKGKPRKVAEDVMADVSTAWTAEQFRELVSAGLSITEARALRDDGFEYEIALDLAREQSARVVAAAAEAQSATAKAMQKAMKPENAMHPGKSCFSHPEGDMAVPK